jgi:hypothetical protein
MENVRSFSGEKWKSQINRICCSRRDEALLEEARLRLSTAPWKK